MTTLLKVAAARLPEHWQAKLKRIHFSRQINNNTFETPEPEFNILSELISPGDWVIDIGANVGHYTKRFSELVGKHGRVIAFEPIPATFSLLAANVELFSHANVTMINSAASEKTGIANMTIPKFATGLSDYYDAYLNSDETDDGLPVLTLQVDSLNINQPVALIKIDAEGHEPFVIAGMKKLIEESLPILIIETVSEEMEGYLLSLGYAQECLPGSPNTIFKQKKKSTTH